MRLRSPLPRFPPSSQPPAVLEALLVHRQALLTHLLLLIEQGVSAGAPPHLLLTGPHGIGKTHLLALLYHRLRAVPGLPERVCLAWLREEWGVDSPAELLRRVLEALDAQDPQAALTPRIAALCERPLHEVEAAAAQLLAEVLAGRPLLILCESFDDICRAFGEDGLRRLRALLADDGELGRCGIVATAPRLPEAAQPQALLHGLFQVHPLAPLPFADSLELLRRLAAHHGDSELTTLLATSRGEARTRALHHLSGGNPRVTLALAALLRTHSPDALLQLFADLLDALTPEYRARMQVLTAPQRKLLEVLCQRRGAVPLTVLARDCLLPAEQAERLLDDLARQGYVSARGPRPLRYELREGLLRLCLRALATRHSAVPRDLPLPTEILHLWYAPAELLAGLSGPAAAPVRALMERALRPGEGRPELLLACLRDLEEHFRQHLRSDAGQVRLAQPERALALAEQMIAMDERAPSGWLFKTLVLLLAGRLEEALPTSARLAELHPDDEAALGLRATVLSRLGLREEVVKVITRLLERSPRAHDASAWWVTLAQAHAELQHLPEAHAAYERALALAPDNPQALRGGAACLSMLRRDLEALDLAERCARIDPTDFVVWHLCGVSQQRLGRPAQALAAFERALALPPGPHTAELLVRRAAVLNQLARYGEALESCLRALLLDKNQDHEGALCNQSRALMGLGRPEEALSAAQRAVQADGHSVLARVCLGHALIGLKRSQDALSAFEAVHGQLGEPELDRRDAAWALGSRGLALMMNARLPDAVGALRQSLMLQPDDGEVHGNLGVALAAQGLLEEALPAFRRAAELCPGDVGRLENLAVCLRRLGRRTEALEALDRALLLTPERAKTLALCAAVAADTGDPLRALRCYEAALAHGDQTWQTRFHLAGLLLVYDPGQHPGMAAVAAALAAFRDNDEAVHGGAALLLRCLLESQRERLLAPARAGEVVAVFRASSKLAALAQGLLRSIPQLGVLGERQQAAWFAAWEQAGSGEAVLQAALRLLWVGVAHLNTGNPRVLLALSLEERALLLPHLPNVANVANVASLPSQGTV